MLGAVLSLREWGWAESLTELGPLEPGGIPEGGGLGLVESLQSALLSESWDFDFLIKWFLHWRRSLRPASYYFHPPLLRAVLRLLFFLFLWPCDFYVFFDDHVIWSTSGVWFSTSVTVAFLESGTGYSISLSAHLDAQCFRWTLLPTCLTAPSSPETGKIVR